MQKAKRTTRTAEKARKQEEPGKLEELEKLGVAELLAAEKKSRRKAQVSSTPKKLEPRASSAFRALKDEDDEENQDDMQDEPTSPRQGEDFPPERTRDAPEDSEDSEDIKLPFDTESRPESTDFPARPRAQDFQGQREEYMMALEEWKATIFEIETRFRMAKKSKTRPVKVQEIKRPNNNPSPKDITKVFDKLGTITKFTPDLARTTPFYLWWLSFSREMSILNLPESQVILNLKTWVSRACWEHWSEYLSDEEASSLDVLIKELNKKYPGDSNPLKREQEFRSYKQKSADVNLYSQEKAHLFKLAFPTEDPKKSNIFYTYWLEGVWEDFRMALITKGIDEFEDAMEYCQRREIALKSVKGTYGSWKTSPNRAETQVCRTFQRTGSCIYGAQCRFAHSGGQKEANKPRTYEDKKPASTPRDPTLPNPNDDCKRPGCKDKPKHPFTRCTQPGKKCEFCGGNDHTKHYCKSAICKKCGKNGHTAFVCSNPEPKK